MSRDQPPPPEWRPKDLQLALRAAGVVAIFGPGTNIPDAAAEVLSLIRKVRTKAA